MFIKSTKLSWIVVSNIQEAKNFYVDKLGLELIEENLEYGWLELKTKDSSYRLGIALFNAYSNDKAGQNSIMTFDVKSIDEAIKYYKEKGVIFVDEIQEVPFHVKMISFVDQDGNTFQLCERLDNKY